MDSKLSIVLVFGVLITAWEVRTAAVNCTVTGTGRFAVPDDPTCQNYTLCVYNSANNSYISYNYVCPTTSVFNPSTSKCTASSNYVCNMTSSICTADGYVSNPSSTNCTSFIECVKINGAYVETAYACPDSTFFNPNTTYCESDYNCTTSRKFNCSTPGRFADTSDTTCQKYHFCVLANNGTYIQYNYTCPYNSVFDPTVKVCTTRYKCKS